MTKTFYHSSDRPLTTFQRDFFLRPGTHRQAINGREDSFVFVSDDEQHSLTYAVTKGVRLMNGHVDETGAQFLMLDREAVIGDPLLKGGIFSLQSDVFEQVIFNEIPSNQWVTTTPVDLSGADYRRITSFNDLMAKNIQLYQLADHYMVDDWHKESSDCSGDQAIYDLICARIDEGKIRWMNEERGINPTHPFPENESLETPARQGAPTLSHQSP